MVKGATKESKKKKMVTFEDEESSSSTTMDLNIITDDSLHNVIPKKVTDLLYTLNDIPPWYTCLLCGFQVFILAFGIFSVPLMLAPRLCIPNDADGYTARANLIGTLYFSSGINTILQTTIGSRLPILQGTSGTHLPPTFALLSLPHNRCPPPLPAGFMNSNVTMYNDTDGTIVDGTELWQRRMRELQGALAVSSIVEIFIGFFGIIGFFLRFIGPVTVAPTIILIGLSLIPVCTKFARSQWGIAFFVFFIVIICSQYLGNTAVPFPKYDKEEKKWKTSRVRCFKLFAIIIALLVGYLLCLVLTFTNVIPKDPTHYAAKVRIDTKINVIHTAPWFRFPYPGQWGLPTVTVAGFAAMLSAVVASIIETIGDYYACAKVSGAPQPPAHAINRGIFVEGVACAISAVLGSGFATTSFATSVAAVSLTKVGSRRVLQVTGIIFAFMGMFGKLGGFFVMIPDPILGGLLLVIFGTIVATGLQNFVYINLNAPRNLFIIGTTIFVAMTVTYWSEENPKAIQTGIPILNNVFTVLLQSSVFLGCMIAVFLDNTIPGESCYAILTIVTLAISRNVVKVKILISCMIDSCQGGFIDLRIVYPYSGGFRNNNETPWENGAEGEHKRDFTDADLQKSYDLPFATDWCGPLRSLIPIMPGYRNAKEKSKTCEDRVTTDNDNIPLAILDN